MSSPPVIRDRGRGTLVYKAKRIIATWVDLARARVVHDSTCLSTNVSAKW